MHVFLVRIFTGTPIYLLLCVNDVSSDFISKGRVLLYLISFRIASIPKVCTVIHETIFHIVSMWIW
jgi:hypothetical protein